MNTAHRSLALAMLAAISAGPGGGTKVNGATWAFQPKPIDEEQRDKLREKRKLAKLETARKRGLLQE